MTNKQFADWLSMAWPHGFEIKATDDFHDFGHVVFLRLPNGDRRVCGRSSMTKYSWRGLAAGCHDELQRLFAEHPELWDDDATIPMAPY